ncbi:single-stranded DNA-binding protein [Periweissella cryptocerci]|uniref:Single-stranded DNA-binding protein n=1 Tax=Periweissella cryptocerci TaxID=2506420 RepID=A0A4P6YVV8_9LACO|nr:single-stranded DNA-binding protein [Periweissella cryptocerci]QBO36954.1 single-stranded DNA-binding protein [Periweissella cryptocerci]
MINRVVLIGRLTKDVELKFTQSGTAVGSFNLAVNRQFTNNAGEREADFISAVIWRKAAENLANFTHKGSLIGIEGRLNTRNYENQQGTRVYVTEVVVDNFSLLEPKGDNNAQRGDTFGGQQFNQGAATNNQSNPTEQNGFGQNIVGGASGANANDGWNNQPQPQGNFGTGQTGANNTTNYAQPNIAGGQTNNVATQNTQQSTFGQGNPFGANGQEIDISDDDLPF